MGFRLLFLIFLPLLLTVKPIFADSQMEIFSDPNFSSATTQFIPGETVHIKIESDDPGEKTRQIKLKDNQYRDISTFQLSRESNAPYIYKVSFSTPQDPGFYSVEATIASESSQNKLVKTIQVGGSSNVNTKINVKAEVQGTKSIKTPQPAAGQPQAETPTFTPSPVASPEANLPQTANPASSNTQTTNFWNKVLDFFQSVFKFFFRL